MRRVMLFILSVACLFLALVARGESTDAWPLGVRHVGAVYLDADKGPLEIEIFKKDNSSARGSQRMRLFLSAPDGTIVDEFVLPSHTFAPDTPRGTRGPQQSHVLRADVEHPGVYTLLVTFEEYRYGEGAVWGFKTNAGRYMLDAGSGHKDSARNERIILDNPGVPGEICFVPQQGDFTIELTGLPPQVRELVLLDADDKPVQELLVVDGKLKTVIKADSGNRDGLWRLQLPSQKVVAQIEGVTFWGARRADHPPLAVWTTGREHYFDLSSQYWLLRPRNLARVVEGEGEQHVAFTLYNSAQQPIRVRLEPQVDGLDSEALQSLGIRAVPQELTLASNQSQQVELRYIGAGVPAQGVQIRLHADAQGIGGTDAASYRAYASLDLRREEAGERIAVAPLQLKPGMHEEQRFAYNPDYPVGAEPYFSPQNVPWLISGDQLWFRNGAGEWIAISNIPDLLRQRHGRGWVYHDSLIGFDKDGAAYLTLRSGPRYALVRVALEGQQIDTVVLPGDEQGMITTYIETPSLFAQTDGLPVLYRATRDGDRPRVPGQRWGRNHRLELLVPQFEQGVLSVGDPIVVSTINTGIASHSGMPHSVLSSGDKIHVVWGDTSGAEDQHAGVPTYAGSWKRSGEQIGETVLLGFAPPVNDMHNTPSLVMDSRGRLHAVVGAHNRSFLYAQSLEPDSTAAWTPSEEVAPGHSQTYVGLAIDRNDTLHLVFREWRREPMHEDVFDAALFYQRKESGAGWSQPEPLILPPLPHYSVWYHKLTADRLGRLFLSYDYWSTWMAYRSVERDAMRPRTGIGRKLLFSGDAGKQWFMAKDTDFESPSGMTEAAPLPASPEDGSPRSAQ